MKLDVLHVIPDLELGGAEHIAAHLVRKTDLRRFTTGAVCLGPARHSPLEARLAAEGVPVWFLDKPAGFSARCCVQLGRLLAQCGPRLLHTHRHVMPHVLPLLLARRELRAVHTVHNLADKEAAGAMRWTHRLAFRAGVVPVAIARAVQRSLESLYGAHDVPLIPNGIPVGRFAPDPRRREDARASLGYGRDDVVFVCVARLCEQKNHAALLDAFMRGPARSDRAHLLLVGDGPLRGALEERARALGLARTRFAGAHADVAPFLAAADVAVLASHWEGSPLSVMEAMAAGLPVVGTAVGGMPELIHHGHTGLLVPAGARVAMASALRRLLSDRERRERMGRAALAHAQRHFDGRVMAQRYEALYEQVLGGVPALAASGA